MTLTESLEQLNVLAQAMLSKSRLEHSLSVADTAAIMCQRMKLDTLTGRVIAMAHDLCKELPLTEQFALASGWDMADSQEAIMDSRLAHGPAAATMLSGRGILVQPELLEAVAWHTVGKIGMGMYAQVLYAADKLEPGRGAWRADTRAAWLSGAFDGPDGMRLLIVTLIEDNIRHLRSKGLDVAPSTLILYNSITGKNSKA